MDKLERSIDKMAGELKKKEASQDALLRLTRELVRECSVGIKLVHSKDMQAAEVQKKKAHELLLKIKKLEKGFEYLVDQSYQEYVELVLLVSIVKREEHPTHESLKLPFGPFMTGLLDCVGELRRQMLEELRAGNKNDAEYYFEVMSRMYEATLPLRFSNSILPNFRKKQDVARMQVESARSELLRSR
jgi:translin